jgi:hypothetical protein
VTLKTLIFDGQPNGSAMSIANSDDFGDVAVSEVTINGGTLAYTTADKMHGTTAIALAQPTAASTTFFSVDDAATSAVYSARFYCKLNSLPSATGFQGPFLLRTTAAALGRTELSATGQVRLSLGATTGTYSTSVLSVGTWYRFEVYGTGIGTASSTMTCDVYVGDATGTPFITVTLTGQTTAAQCQRARFGKGGGTMTFDMVIDDVALNIGSSTPLGPVSTSQAAAGAVALVTTVSGAPTVHTAVNQASGTVAVVSNTAGGIFSRYRVTGTAPVVASLSGNPSGPTRYQVAGVVDLATTVSGTLSGRKRPGDDAELVQLFDEEKVLAGGRVTLYRFDLLDSQENLIGQLGNVEPGGEVSIDAYSSVKGVGSIRVRDIGVEEVDWLNVRIRPWATIQRAGGGDPSPIEVPLGVYLCAAPVEEWTSEGRAWTVELTDKLSILDQDIASSAPVWSPGGGVAHSGMSAFGVEVGSNIVEIVLYLIHQTGELTPAIEPSTAVTAAPMVWDIGATRLKIVNDLLDAGNFFSLWVDGMGQYQVTPYVYPTQRTPIYESLLPFSVSETSLMTPEWTRDRDIYSIPNRYVVIGQGDGTTEALVAEAVNDDPLSPFSVTSRGRAITVVETGVEAVDQAALDAIAARRLSAATSRTTSITVKHAFLPDLTINAVVRFVNPDAGLDIRCTVLHTKIPFHPTTLCESLMNVVGG